MKTIFKANQIKLILTRKSKTQGWFAHKLDISRSYLSQLLTGKRYPSPKLREAILKVLEKDESCFDEFFEIVESGK